MRGARCRAAYFLLRRWWRVLRSSLRCFFFAMRLRRFLMTEPTETSLSQGLDAGMRHPGTGTEKMPRTILANRRTGPESSDQPTSAMGVRMASATADSGTR